MYFVFCTQVLDIKKIDAILKKGKEIKQSEKQEQVSGN